MEAQNETAAPGGAPETADKNECTLAQYSTPLTLVVFEADRPITKTLRLDGDGELEKKTPPQMARGKARRYRLENVGEFVEMLEFLEPRHALAFGEPCDPARDEFAVVTKDKLPAVTTPGVIARSREFFQWANAPGVLLLDFDAPKDGEPLGIDAALGALFTAVPELEAAPMVIRPSSSSCIWHGERELAGLRGFHIYVIVADARRIPELGETIKGRLWLAGFGRYEVSKSGALLERTLVDASVWQPERLVFAAGAHCIAPLEQRRGPPIVRHPEAPPLDGLPPLTQSERKRIGEVQHVARQAVAPLAREKREAFAQELADELSDGTDLEHAAHLAQQAIEKKILHGDFPLILEDGRTVTVGEVLDHRARYHGALCHDPLEPDYDGGRLVGKLFLVGMRPTLKSFAHGGSTYRLIRAPRRVEIVGGRTRELADWLLEYLRKADDVFDFGSELATVSEGRVIPFKRERLAYYLGGEFQFFGKKKQRDGSIVDEDRDPPPKVIDTLLALGAERKLKPLEAVVSAPLVRLDGQVLTAPGYDHVSRLFYDPGAETPPIVPEAPTAEEIDAALDAIMAPFEYFPFAGVLDRSVLLAALLSAVERPVLPTCPGFGFDAPVQGSGKTLLASALCVLATGEPPTIWPHVKSERGDDAEVRKRLTTALVSGERAIVWDNVVGTFDSAALAATLTAPIYRDRILGVSEATSVPNRALFCVTGNNLILSGDLPRRFLVCRIDPQSERPFARRFAFDPVERVRRQRQRLAAAACVIIRGWLSSSDYRDGIRAPGSTASFERWDELVRQPVAWLARRDPQHWRDPMDAITGATASDPELDSLGDLLEALAAAFGAKPFMTRDVFQRLEGYGRDPELAEAFAAFLGGEPRSAKQIGRLLLYRRDRIARGLMLRRLGDDLHEKVARWIIQREG
ncbi:hypothetical protein [Tepidiphilus succinatimandens]|uniref:hypothetical protein n=1 Tax=Tepidiphilus succinatimandens TaxID=224436 RepID=UPI00112F3C34|nr:hypothetical protein [Tepidiphilus succinatimandens]